MAASELQQLKQEEKMLISIAGKLNDQLNRLKVEELELMSKIRARSLENLPKTEEKDDEDGEEDVQDLDLNPATETQHDEGEEEEDEDMWIND